MDENPYQSPRAEPEPERDLEPPAPKAFALRPRLVGAAAGFLLGGSVFLLLTLSTSHSPAAFLIGGTICALLGWVLGAIGR